MKLCFVCGFGWEPKGTVRARAFPLAAELARRGHEVTLVIVPYDAPAHSGVTESRAGVRIVNIEVPARGLAFVPRTVSRCLRAIRACNADVIHVFKPKGFASLVYRVLRRGDIPLVLDSDDWEGWGGWNEAKSYPWIVKEYIHLDEVSLTRRAPVQTFASVTLLARARKLRNSKAGLFFVPNAASHELFESLPHDLAIQNFRRELATPNKSVILYVGHFEAADDVGLVARTIAPILQAGNAELWVIGDGPLFKSFREALRPCKGAARYFGELNYRQYLLAVSAADFAYFPYPDTLVYRAKCSARVIDYMAAAKPLVSNAVGSNRQYVRSGITGILAPPGDERRLLEATSTLVDNNQLCRKMGAATRELLHERFTWAGMPTDSCERAYDLAMQLGNDRDSAPA